MVRSKLVVSLASWLLAVTLIGTAWGQAPERLDPGQIYKRVSPAVVGIEVLGPNGKVVKTGTGFLVAADGKLLTNYHVISRSKQASVRLANDDIYDAVEVLAVDKRKDIAFLKIPAVELPFLKLGRSGTIQVGDTVYSVSNPLGILPNTLSQGLISGLRQMEGYRVFQISAPISEGSSGGPLFNTAGEVIGIVAMQIREGQNLNFAIPIDYARGMLSANNPQPLASIYELEPPSEAPASAKAEPSKPEVVNTRPAASVIPDEMRKGAFLFLERQMGTWKLDDARAVLGEPTRQRDALAGTKVDGVIYAFRDPTNGMREFELNFGNSTGRLRAVYAYPYRATLREAQALWGRNYKEVKYPNGNRSYVYRDRRLIVLTDKNDLVISIGVYLP